MTRRVRLGSRRSALALMQAGHVAMQLAAVGVEVDIVGIDSDGDGGEGAFTAADRGVFAARLERELVAGTIDLAVHSLKDVPADIADGTELAAFSEREDPRDVLVVHESIGVIGGVADLPDGTIVGTASSRRRALLADARPDLRVETLRGNVPTRIDAVRSGRVAVAVLAAAGLRRLDRAADIAVALPVDSWVPDAGQGAIVVQARTGELPEVAALDVEDSRTAVTLERGLAARLGAGCEAPVGVHAHRAGDNWNVHAFVAPTAGGAAGRASIDVAAMDLPATDVPTMVDALADAGLATVLSQMQHDNSQTGSTR